MKSIDEERARIDEYRSDVGAAEFFNDPKYKEDFEWLILSYLTRTLRLAGLQTPSFAEKLAPPAPDFQTYFDSGIPCSRVEVTEVLRPQFHRNKFFVDMKRQGLQTFEIPEPHPMPWLSFRDVLRKKLSKSYAAGSWLLVYHDMSDSEYTDGLLWHERILGELRTWTLNSDTTVDITASLYASIYVVDPTGTQVVRLHPQWDVISIRQDIL